MSDFYEYTDKALKYLRRFFIREFNRTESIIRTDELNVIQATTSLYDKLRRETIRVFLRIANNKYRELGGDALAEMWLLGLLGRADPLTGYIFLNDVDRKRQYYTESLMAGDSADKATKKALRYWYQAVKQYADIVTDEAAMQAFADTNTQFVQWVTAHDESVCETCLPRDGMIYPLNHAPRLPAHYGCRCFYRRVNGNAT